ncbi:MAG TPA: type II secretion system protein [Candidatus Cloacimonas sp.]|nr:type II secretion system protein [Candidatus Cloacimonas sp.]
MMKHRLFNEKGFTLTETVAVMAISSLLIVTAALGIGVFFRKYQELSAYVDLQKDMVSFLNVLKYGQHIGTRSSEIEFIGITSAKGLKQISMTSVPGISKGIQITPPISNLYPTDFVNYYLHDGYIKMEYKHHGTDSSSPTILFPEKKLRDRVIIEDFLISDANKNNAIFKYMPNEQLCIINVDLKAKVKIRGDEYKSVHYKTTMAMKNMERPSTTTP